MKKRITMMYPMLQDYLDRLPRAPGPGRHIWLGADGHAQGRYFHCTLTSVFQPVHALATGEVVAHEAFIRSVARNGPALSVWKLLEGAASDAESIELDRLCRMLHAINFWRQPGSGSAQLHLSVHQRLLAAVAQDHGLVFRRVLDGLGLPIERIVLQLPGASAAPEGLLRRVAANYQRNGFRIALHAATPAEAQRLLRMHTPDVLKLDAREIVDAEALDALAQACDARGVALVFKRVERQAVAAMLQVLPHASRIGMAQGRAWQDVSGLLAAPGMAVQARRPGGAAPVHAVGACAGA
jgi:EAL domain-containing protein (putative c-di-GMP-specific phosphodiesterase class I)